MFLIFCRQNQLVIVVGLRLTATCAAGSTRIQIKVVARLEFHFGGGGRKERAEPNKSSAFSLRIQIGPRRYLAGRAKRSLKQQQEYNTHKQQQQWRARAESNRGHPTNWPESFLPRAQGRINRLAKRKCQQPETTVAESRINHNTQRDIKKSHLYKILGAHTHAGDTKRLVYFSLFSVSIC